MSITGSLLTMPLAELLVWIQTTRKSGVVTILRDGGEWELGVSEGKVTGYAGPELRDNLGHLVVASGMLTETDLRGAYQMQRKAGGSLQQALLELGLLTRDQLQECLREIATESIYDLFIDLPGEFVYSEAQQGGLTIDFTDFEAERLPLDLDVNQLLMEGARRQDEWNAIRDRYPRDNIQVEILYDRLPPLESMGVRERRVLASLDAGQSISDICFELRAPIPSIVRTIDVFVRRGAARIKEAAEEAPGDSRRVEQLVEQSVVMREAGQYDEAIALLDVAVRMRPDDDGLRDSLRDAIEEQLRALYSMLPPIRVPVVVVDDARVKRLKLRSEERFLLTRLPARMDIGGLVMVSSMSERETLRTLRKLLHSGIIALE